MIVTIDGPAGAGKSSAARALAQRLGFRFLDTGAMYRAVALAARVRGVAWNDPHAMAELARDVMLELIDDRVYLDGDDVTAAIRTPEVTALTRFAANNAEVRRHLVSLQREAAAGGDVVAEGRDQGTVVFPHAECKIFLTATPEERARRRVEELALRGQRVTFDEVLAQQEQRDREDCERAVGALRPADDAISVYTDGLTPAEVVDKLESLVSSCQAASQDP